MLVAGVGLAPSALAQGSRVVVQGLEENQGLIRQCRQINQTAQVFDNTSLGPVTNRLGTLPAGTRVSLTGVVVQGRAQIFLPSNFNGLSSSQPVGWVSAGFLTGCGGSPPPTARACFRANLPLSVRTAPSTNAGILANYTVGDTVYASTNPPTRQTPGNGHTWLQVRIFDGSVGWVTETSANGQIEDITAIRCP
ncbi:SH3 domain-containing protein [Nodosilinea sp. E11]|uniref:SH3 domain-containing protein n=1 Tax=Nodosilinea sp. E11 TaxID=3037479 RepID=UPI0029347BB0|nr:SH3 domain-containing protein [Nodosilinea sp. E11]WOD41506.1 SH3 domain-containing protein [Nodosilinea sp. E11]